MSALVARAAIGLSPIQKTGIILAFAIGSWLVAIVIGMQAALIATELMRVLFQ